jgi:hypothetical protein
LTGARIEAEGASSEGADAEKNDESSAAGEDEKGAEDGDETEDADAAARGIGAEEGEDVEMDVSDRGLLSRLSGVHGQRPT